jgi:hypothetical protein
MHHLLISPKWDVRLMLFKILVKATQANKRSKTPKKTPCMIITISNFSQTKQGKNQ